MPHPPEFVRIRTALARSFHFRELGADDLDAIARLARIRRLRNGEWVSRVGSRRREVWVVLSGSMRMSSPTASGREFVYAIIGPGSFYGIGSTLSGDPTTVDARAAGATSLIVIDGGEFIALLDRRRWLWRHVAKLLHQRLILAMAVVRDLGSAPLAQRIARRLLGQAMSRGSDVSGEAAVELRLTQADLGGMLDASRSMVNAELKRLERDGLLQVGYRTITLTNCPQLRKLAGPDVFAF